MIVSILAKKLEDKVKQRKSGFLLVSKTLELISKATDSPIDDVKKYLLFSDIDIEIPVYHYKGGSRFEVMETSRPDGYFTGTRKALKEPLEGDEYFLADDLNKFEPLLEYDIFAYERGYHYIAIQSVGRFKTGEKVTGLTEDRARNLLKEGAIEKQPVKDKKSKAIMNNSLASYVSDYTLPQVVALILHIDLADITTTPNNSYIHNQNDYDESVYHKFENLLQSYSVAALNNKLHGVDLHTRTVIPYGGDNETHIDLEKTSISRSSLASYLNSIGYELDNLIAKQESVYGMQNEVNQVLSLTQQLRELQEQLMIEKGMQAETKEEAIEANVKILNLTAKLEDAELDSIIYSHPAHKSLLKEAKATIDQLSEENAELRANKKIESSQPKQDDKVSDQTVEKIKKMTADYEKLSLKYENLESQNKDLLNKIAQHKQDSDEELIQHWDAESRKYKSKIEELETVIKECSDVEILSQAGDWQLYNWKAMDGSQYPPELHLAIEIWKRYYKADDTEYVARFNTGKFNRIARDLNLKDGKLKNRIRSILTPLSSKKTSAGLLTTLREVDIIYNDKMPI